MLAICLIILYSSAFVLFLCERLYPAHKNNNSGHDRLHWYLRAAFINSSNLAVFYAAEGLLSWLKLNDWISQTSLVEMAGLTLDLSDSPLIAALLAYFVFTFVVYWWHRLRHSNNFCWRWFHQLHHSPEEIETLTAYYIHPFDLIANLVISNSIIYLVLGLDSSVAPFYTLITGLAGFVIHANVRIPRWIGYVFQTPEMHRIHHRKNHHNHNYTDLVWWDMLFGTYYNPRQPFAECGFAKPQQQNLKALLFGKQVKIN